MWQVGFPCDDCPLTIPQQDQVQEALEAVCAALMILQAIEVGRVARRRGSGRDLHLTRAIESLRVTTAELRLAREEPESQLGAGFVVRRFDGRLVERQARP